MTAPSGSGRGTTLQPGDPAKLLTEYAPSGDDAGITIINDSTTRAYLADDSGVSATSGVPLDPHTAILWTSSGQLWAAVDQAETDPAVLIVTGAVNSWQPSPAVIGVEVAEQLLQSGVPNVLLEEQLLGTTLYPGNSTYPPVDVSKWASVVLVVNASGGFGGPNTLLVTFSDQELDTVSTELLPVVLNARAYVLDTSLCASIGLSCGTLAGGIGAGIELIGSNRIANRRVETRRNAAFGVRGVQASGPLAAGSTSVLLPSVQMQGECFARFEMAAGTAARGYFDYLDDFGNPFLLCDYSELSAISNGNLDKIRNIYLPAGAVAIRFRCITAGTSSLLVELTPAP